MRKKKQTTTCVPARLRVGTRPSGFTCVTDEPERFKFCTPAKGVTSPRLEQPDMMSVWTFSNPLTAKIRLHSDRFNTRQFVSFDTSESVQQ